MEHLMTPKINKTAYISDKAVIVGDVTIGKHSSVFYFSTIRGDNNSIVIGDCSNIQESCTIHCETYAPVLIGDNVTIGHGAILHGCTIKSNSLIGMGAIILDGAVVEENCLVGAGSLVTSGTVIPSGYLAIGSPARAVRPLKKEELSMIANSANDYITESKKLFG